MQNIPHDNTRRYMTPFLNEPTYFYLAPNIEIPHHDIEKMSLQKRFRNKTQTRGAHKPKPIRTTLILLVALLTQPIYAQQPQQQNQRRRPPLPTVEQIMERLPDGVKFIPDIPYREGNKTWKLDLAMPEEHGDTPRPAIVFIHGGGWRNGDKRAGAFLQPTIDYAAKGYVCITINYRMLDEAPITACVEDVKNAVRWLRAHAEEYNIDPNRIGATGNSAGAHLSVMLALCPPSAGLEGDGPYREHSSMVQAVAASATPTSFLIPMSERARQRKERARNGEAPQAQAPNSPQLESEETRAKISPMSYVTEDTPPILLFHEASDRTVGVYHSDNLVDALRKAGSKDVNYILLGDGSGHGTYRRNLAFTEPAREAFFNRVLKSED